MIAFGIPKMDEEKEINLKRKTKRAVKRLQDPTRKSKNGQKTSVESNITFFENIHYIKSNPKNAKVEQKEKNLGDHARTEERYRVTIISK